MPLFVYLDLPQCEIVCWEYIVFGRVYIIIKESEWDMIADKNGNQMIIRRKFINICRDFFSGARRSFFGFHDVDKKMFLCFCSCRHHFMENRSYFHKATTKEHFG
jgi:hypothetical protein